MKVSRSSSKVKVKGQDHTAQKRPLVACIVGNIITVVKEAMGTEEFRPRVHCSFIPHQPPLESSDPASRMIIYSTPYMNGRATTRGVFKAYVFFFNMSL